MTTETLIALVSVIAAVISTLMAWHSAVTARSALKIAEADHKEKYETIKPYLIDGICWQNDKLENFVSFACSFTNGANAPNTIIRMDLSVHAYDEEGNLSQVILNPIIEDTPLAVGFEEASSTRQFGTKIDRIGVDQFQTADTSRNEKTDR